MDGKIKALIKSSKFRSDLDQVKGTYSPKNRF